MNKQVTISYAVALLIGAAQAQKYTVFDNNIPGLCSGAIETINRNTNESTGTGTIAFDMEGGKFQGKAFAEGVTGEYRRATGAFVTEPDKAKFAFYDPSHTLYWTEPYDDGDYYYTGTLNEDGTFDGFYNSAGDADMLNANIDDTNATKSGKVRITGVTCQLDDGAVSEVTQETQDTGNAQDQQAAAPSPPDCTDKGIVGYLANGDFACEFTLAPADDFKANEGADAVQCTGAGADMERLTSGTRLSDQTAAQKAEKIEGHTGGEGPCEGTITLQNVAGAVTFTNAMGEVLDLAGAYQPRTEGWQQDKPAAQGGNAGGDMGQGGATSSAQDQCGPRQRVDPQGNCLFCDDYLTKSADGMSCVKPDCAYNEIIVFDGTCSTCPMFNVADEAKTKCKLPDCPDGWKIGKDGKCSECPPYMKSFKSNFRCDRQICGLYTVLMKDGNCAEPECKENEFIHWKGECQPCPEYQTVVGKKTCEAPTCAINQMVTKAGKCEKCGPYQRVTTDQKSCEIMMCPTETHVLEFDGKCSDPTIQENENKDLKQDVEEKEGQIKSHLVTIDGIEKTKVKQRYQIQSEFTKTKATAQAQQYGALLAAYQKGAADANMVEGTKGKIDFADYEITEGVCSDGLLKYLYESKVITFNYDYKLKHKGVGCAPEKLNLGPTDTLDKCMKKYVDAIEAGKCDKDTNAVEFVPNEHCDCCAPEYSIQLTNKDTKYDNYNVYQLLKNPVYLDGKPERPIQAKAEMEFCEQLCSRDPACTAFQFDETKVGSGDNCKIWNRQRYTGDGSADHLCFVKKAAVDTEHLKMVKHNAYCPDHHVLSREKDNLEQCAAKVIDADECADGQNVFFHRKYDQFCGCCTKASALDDATPIFDKDLNMYQRETGQTPCNQKNCMTCKADDMNECAQCDDGYRLAFGACFNFEF